MSKKHNFLKRTGLFFHCPGTWQAIACIFIPLLSLPACATQEQSSQPIQASAIAANSDSAMAQAARNAANSQAYMNLAPVWRPLARRLANDGLHGPAVMALLEQLGPVPTQSPMGRKIKELYRRQFMPSKKTVSADQYYKGVVTEANAELCRQFVREHETAFTLAREKYGVPPQIASALLFVETRLGKVLADVPENAFYTLASMAVCDKPGDISQYLSSLPGYQKHLPWLEETMRKRADWAYNETRALMEHMLRDNIAPGNLPSSIYGAVGLCQFMPSNISAYGADGDGDGRVDLFNVPDAVASLAKYLAAHGWRPGISVEKRHKVLMSYNHSQVYANTILALAALVDGAGSPKIQKARAKSGGAAQ